VEEAAAVQIQEVIYTYLIIINMTPNTNPLFAIVPLVATCTVVTANANMDGITGSNILLYTAPTGHAKITSIQAKCLLSATTACIVRIFVSEPTGTTFYLKDEIALTAITGSTTVATATNTIIYSDFEIQSGQKIVVTTSVSQSINVLAQIGILGQ
jgi:hypothetical protein